MSADSTLRCPKHPDRVLTAQGNCCACLNEEYVRDYLAEPTYPLSPITRLFHLVYPEAYRVQRSIRLKLGAAADHIPASELQRLAEQGTCEICCRAVAGSSKAIDHDHKSGKVRGVLCRTCNSGLGFFKNSPKLLRSAISYLKRSNDEKHAKPQVDSLGASSPHATEHRSEVSER